MSDTTGAPRWAGATPGGVNQLPWNAQTVARLLAGEERPGMLVAAPLWEWMPDDDGVRVEAGFAADDVEALRPQAQPRRERPAMGVQVGAAGRARARRPVKRGKPPPTLAPSASHSASERVRDPAL